MFVLEILRTTPKVVYYTIRQADNEFNETEKFVQLVSESQYLDQLNDLLAFLNYTLGEITGAQEYWFNRFERKATALPPSKKGLAIRQAKATSLNFHLFNYKIRLYCLRLSDSVVVLFNGGIKELDGPAQEDPNVSMQFHEANIFAEKISQAISDGTICVKHKSVVGFNKNTNNLNIE